LIQEEGIDVDHYYMDETEALLKAWGLPAIDKILEPASVMALTLTDRTGGDDERPKHQLDGTGAVRPSVGKPTRRPWWKFW